MSEEEEWRPVVGFEDHYEVSSMGRVRRTTATTRFPAGHILRLQTHPMGRLEVGLCVNGKPSRQKVHRLVAFAFLGEPASLGLEVCHNNGDPTDNRVANLRWDTHAENIRDSVRHGTNHNSRKTRCVRGHSLTGPNVRIEGRARTCRKCDLARTHKYRERKRRERAEREDG